MSLSVIILAAGKGTRMRSRLPKVLHPLAGRPMLQHVLHTARALEPSALAVVVGAGDDVRSALDDQADVVVQAEQRGTGHAVAQAERAVAGRADTVLVLYGDTPLITTPTLRRLIEAHAATAAAITLLTTHIADPALRPNGRVVRDAAGAIVGIVEAPEATPEQRAIDECNMGIYAFRDGWLWPNLGRVEPSHVKGEIYLTSLVGLAIAQGESVGAVATPDYSETLGVDTRALLAAAEAVYRRRVNQLWLDRGITIIDPATTYIDAEVEIGADTIIHPNSHLQGATRVGARCVVGPNAVLRDATLGAGSRVLMAVLEAVEVSEDSDVPPFSHLTR